MPSSVQGMNNNDALANGLSSQTGSPEVNVVVRPYNCLGNATTPLLLNMTCEGLGRGCFQLDGNLHRDVMFVQECVIELKGWLQEGLGQHEVPPEQESAFNSER